MQIIQSSNYIYSVTEDESERSFVVNLGTNTCSCREFQEDELPCRHAVPIIHQKGLDILNYCSLYHLNDTLKKTYDPVVYPISSADRFIVPKEVSNIVVSRPDRKPRSGKPRISRFKSRYEKIQDMRCGICKQRNHNRRTCKNMPLYDV